MNPRGGRRTRILSVVACLFTAVLGACGDGPDAVTTAATLPSPTRSLADDDRDVRVGDCLRPPEMLAGTMPCSAPNWWAKVYHLERGPASAGPCPDPDPSVPAGRLAGLNAGDLLLCLELREPLDSPPLPTSTPRP